MGLKINQQSLLPQFQPQVGINRQFFPPHLQPQYDYTKQSLINNINCLFTRQEDGLQYRTPDGSVILQEQPGDGFGNAYNVKIKQGQITLNYTLNKDLDIVSFLINGQNSMRQLSPERALQEYTKLNSIVDLFLKGLRAKCI